MGCGSSTGNNEQQSAVQADAQVKSAVASGKPVGKPIASRVVSGAAVDKLAVKKSKAKGDHLSVVLILYNEDDSTVMLTSAGNLPIVQIDAEHDFVDNKDYEAVMQCKWGWENTKHLENNELAQKVNKASATISAKIGLPTDSFGVLPPSMINTKVNGDDVGWIAFMKHLKPSVSPGCAQVVQLVNKKKAQWVAWDEIADTLYAQLGRGDGVNTSESWLEELIGLGRETRHDTAFEGLHVGYLGTKLAGRGIQIISALNTRTMIPTVYVDELKSASYPDLYYDVIRQQIDNPALDIAAAGLDDPHKFLALQQHLEAARKELSRQLNKDIPNNRLYGPLTVNDNLRVLVFAGDANAMLADEEAKAQNASSEIIRAFNIHHFNLYHAQAVKPVLAKSAPAATQPPMPEWIVTVLRSSSATATRNVRKRKTKQTQAAAAALDSKSDEALIAKWKANKDPPTVTFTQFVEGVGKYLSENPLPQEIMNGVDELLHDPVNRMQMEQVSLQLGETLPHIDTHEDLLTHKGELYDIHQSNKNGKTLIVVFFRGLWCQVCSFIVTSYSHYYNQIAAKNADIVFVCNGTHEQALKAKKELECPYLFVSDPEQQIVDKLGVSISVRADQLYHVDAAEFLGLDEKVQPTDHVAIPMPATYVFDTNGKVIFRHVNVDFFDRAPPEVVLKAIPDV